MFIFDISNPLTLLLMLAATVLLIFLAQEIKKSAVAAVVLFAYLLLLIIHVAQVATLSEEFRYMLSTLSRCVVIGSGKKYSFKFKLMLKKIET